MKREVIQMYCEAEDQTFSCLGVHSVWEDQKLVLLFVSFLGLMYTDTPKKVAFRGI